MSYLNIFENGFKAFWKWVLHVDRKQDTLEKTAILCWSKFRRESSSYHGFPPQPCHWKECPQFHHILKHLSLGLVIEQSQKRWSVENRMIGNCVFSPVWWGVLKETVWRHQRLIVAAVIWLENDLHFADDDSFSCFTTAALFPFSPYQAYKLNSE